jgi:flagellar motility protein MotE (MotC chaperone)
MNVSRVVAAAVARRREAEAQRLEKVEAQRAQGWDFWTIEIENLKAELSDAKARLAKRSDELDQREARLASERQDLDRIRNDIESIRRDIDARVVTIHSDEAKNLHSLAQTYTNLTPRAAVIILTEMDDSTAVKILSLMKPDIVGAIFEEMARTSGPDAALARRAATLSEKLRLMKAGVDPAIASAAP